MRAALPLLTCALLAPSLASAQATITVTADRARIEPLGVVTVRVEAAGGNVQAPDLESAGWRLVGRSQSVSSFNGRAMTQLTLRLQAMREGQLVIGGFRVQATGGVYQSKPITVTVADGGGVDPSGGGGNADQPGPGGQAARDKHAWVQWGVDRDEVWLGEEVRARLYVFVDPRIRLSNVDTSDLDLKGWWTEHTGQRRRAQRQMEVDGVTYTRIELGYYHLFALRAGELELPPVTVKLRQSRGFFDDGNGARATRTAEPLTITVKALPSDKRPPGFGGPAVGAVKLTVGVDRQRINGDEGVYLTVRTGIRGGRIEATPEVSLPPLPGFKVFPPTTDAKSEVTRGQTRGNRTQRWLLRPKKGGRLTIPALRLPYFDPAKGRYEVASSAPIRVTVRGAPEAVAKGGKQAGSGASASDGPALRTIRKDADLGANDRPLHSTFWFLLALCLPPLGLVGLVARDRALAHIGATAGGRAARRAQSVATADLARIPRDPASAYTAIARVLVAYLDARFEQTFRGLTHGQLGAALAARGVGEDTVRALVTELENCDFARFAPSADAGAVEAAVERSQALVTRIEASV